MPDFTPGQRWISDTELHLGLGTVMESDQRSVTMAFPASGETRMYARQNAPLTRVRFVRGDEIRDQDGQQFTVAGIEEHQGLLIYIARDPDGEPLELPETRLDNLLQLNRPGDRLFSGQIDANKWFALRYASLSHANRLMHSDLHGLTGGRTSLLPHQLYIAHEVAGRFAPRVLLADEVGLGKTIEAGMILHQQLLTERCRRALIVVPETLLHQWLVEMLRRFNLYFSIFDEERCLGIVESSGIDNPFHAEQLVLCSLDFLVSQPQRAAQAVSGNWDLLICDEAHHLHWSPEQSSVEYELVATLARVTPGVLLLTATPEQLGKAGHFARLRLLDADRFSDLDTFIKEEDEYGPIADAVESLLGAQGLDKETEQTLRATVEEGDNLKYIETLTGADDTAKPAARAALVEHLLDRHGTGRILFRNTRAAVKGFPKRELHDQALPLPDAYAACLNPAQADAITSERILICPEAAYRAHGPSQPRWIDFDPRIDWLVTTLRELRPAKILLIAAWAETVLELAEVLHSRHGIHAAVFHEGMSIVERDRAAAYFADAEEGTQLLLCSEIGSEGRNFQFAHHLILFDLPLDPDLLEQRIGRLDRIGQSETIRIHVPWLENSAQAVLYHWYHRALDAFEHTCPAAQAVYASRHAELLACLRDGGAHDLESLLESGRRTREQMNEALHQGRDRLLEYNSCRPGLAESIRERAAQQDDDATLGDYLNNLFDCFGIDSEAHGPRSVVAHPSDEMQAQHFPGIPADGVTLTLHRETALAHENMQFVTWEHPIVRDGMEMVLCSEMGNSGVSALKHRGVKPGTLLLEALYVLEASSSEALHGARYLPPTMMRILIDRKGKTHDGVASYAAIEGAVQAVDSEIALNIMRKHQKELRAMLAAAEEEAGRRAPEYIDQARARASRLLGTEIDRLSALRRVNPHIRDEELAYFENQRTAVRLALRVARPRLDAVRVLLAI